MLRFVMGVFVAWLIVVGLMWHDDWTEAQKQSKVIGNTDRVTIVFWHALSDQLGRVLEELIGRYNASQNKFLVRGISMGNYDTLQKKLLASLVAKSAPDCAINYESLTKKFIRHRKIVCIEDLLGSEAAALKADLVPVLLANNTYDGKMWSFPFNKSVPVMFVNMDILRRFKFDAPPRNLYELASMAQVITAEKDEFGRPKIYGFGFTKNNVWTYECRVLQFGGKLTDEAGREAYLDQLPAQQAMAWYQMMLNNKFGNQYQGYEQQNDFAAGKVAMIESSMVSKVYMEGKLHFDCKMAPLVGAATDAVILSGTNINIFDKGDPVKIQGCLEFVKFFGDPETTAEWSLRTTYMPVRLSALRSPRMVEQFEKDPLLKMVYEQMNVCYFEPRLTHWFECRDMITDAVELAMQERGPPIEYLKPLDRNLDAVLSHTAE